MILLIAGKLQVIGVEFIHTEHAVCEDAVLLEAVFPLGGAEKILIAGHGNGKRQQIGKVFAGAAELDDERFFIRSGHAEGRGVFAAVHRLSVFDAEKLLCIRRGGFGQKRTPETEGEVRRHRLFDFIFCFSIGPHEAFPEGEGVSEAIFRYAIILYRAGNDGTRFRETEQPLENVLRREDGIRVGSQLWVEIGNPAFDPVLERAVGSFIRTAGAKGKNKANREQKSGETFQQQHHRKNFKICAVRPFIPAAGMDTYILSCKNSYRNKLFMNLDRNPPAFARFDLFHFLREERRIGIEKGIWLCYNK